MDKIRVMLVDDHTVLRAGLRMLIQSQPDMEVVAEADNVRDGSALAFSVRPDVLILDLSLPGGPSLTLVETLRSQNAGTNVLMLTMYDDPAYVRAALAAGATGYIVKTIGEADLLEAIRAVHRGRVFVDLDDENLTAKVFQTFVGKAPSRSKMVECKLSGREIEVMRLLGQGYTNQAIAERLDLSPKTVATYRARISEKLGLKTTAEFVKYAVDTGLTGTLPDKE